MRTWLCWAVMAIAAGAAPRAAAQALRLPTSVPGVTTLAGPPPGFDTVHAPDAALAQYGFPPRPALEGDGSARRNWEHLIGHARIRITPELRVLPQRARPMLRHTVTRKGAATSTNWSGLVLSNNAPNLGLGSFTLVVAEFNVPIGQQAFGVCTGGWAYSAVWVGIDGINAPDVLQAGTESDAFCSRSSTQAAYYAWFEWFPGNTIEVTNLPVAAGDVMGAWVYATGPTTGHALLINATTNQYVAMDLVAPAGTVLAGSSVEWIMERPSLSNKLTPLANYVASYMTSMNAARLFEHNFPAAQPPAFTRSEVTAMLDDNGNIISTATLLGYNSMEFRDAGSAN